MADTQSIEESLQALYASYQEFIEKLDGDAQPVTELLEGIDKDFRFLKDLKIPRQINVSTTQNQLSQTRYKQLIASMNGVINLINSCVDKKGEHILDLVPQFLGYYNEVHTLYLLSAAVAKSQAEFVRYNEAKNQLKVAENQLQSLEVPQELILSFDILTLSQTREDKNSFHKNVK